MSDLIKEARVEAKALATSGVKGAGNMINALADALEAKDAEIERLTASIESKDKIIQSQRRAYFQKSTENAKQKVVVDSARAYFKRRKSVYSDLLEDALAALDAQEQGPE